jgi:DNA repair exonuclease SbcCD ATPase subunit
MTTLSIIKTAEQTLTNPSTTTVQLFHVLESCEREYNALQENLAKLRLLNDEQRIKKTQKITHLKAKLAGLEEENIQKEKALQENKLSHTYERQDILNQIHRLMYDHQTHFAVEHDVLASRITGLSAALSSLQPIRESQLAIIAHWKKLITTVAQSEENWRKKVEAIRSEMDSERLEILANTEKELANERSKFRMELIKELHTEFAQMQIVEAKQFEEYREIHQNCAKVTADNVKLKKALKHARWSREINDGIQNQQKTIFKQREKIEKKWTTANLEIGATL